MSSASRLLLLFGGGSPLLSGLYGEYLFDTGSGTTLIDSSGNSRDLTLGFGGAAGERPTWGVVGGIECLTFDSAQNQQISGTGLTSLPQPFTLCLLARMTGGSGYRAFVAGNLSYANATYADGSNITARFPTTKGASGVSYTADSTWRSVIYSISGDDSWGAVDGSNGLFGVGLGANGLLSTGQLMIGSVYRTSAPFHGNIGYVGILPVAIDSSDAATLHSEIMAKRGL